MARTISLKIDTKTIDEYGNEQKLQAAQTLAYSYAQKHETSLQITAGETVTLPTNYNYVPNLMLLISDQEVDFIVNDGADDIFSSYGAKYVLIKNGDLGVATDEYEITIENVSSYTANVIWRIYGR